MELEEIIADIHALNKKLERFEEKYGLLSETLYEMYLAGEEPEDENWVADFALWAGLYEIRLERERMYRQTIQYLLRPRHSIWPHLVPVGVSSEPA